MSYGGEQEPSSNLHTNYSLLNRLSDDYSGQGIVFTVPTKSTSTATSNVINLDSSYNLSLESTSTSIVRISHPHENSTAQHQGNPLSPISNSILHTCESEPNAPPKKKIMDPFDALMNLLSDEDDSSMISNRGSTGPKPQSPNSNKPLSTRTTTKESSIEILSTNGIKLSFFRTLPELSTSSPNKERSSLLNQMRQPFNNTDSNIPGPLFSPLNISAKSLKKNSQNEESDPIVLTSSSPLRSGKPATRYDDKDDNDFLDLLRNPDNGGSKPPPKPANLESFKVRMEPRPVSLFELNNEEDSGLEVTADNIALPSDSDPDDGIPPSRRRNNSLIQSDSSALEISISEHAKKRKKKDPNSFLLESFHELEAEDQQRARQWVNKIKVPGPTVTYKNGFKGSILAELDKDDDETVARRSASDPGFYKRTTRPTFKPSDFSSMGGFNKPPNTPSLSETLSKAMRPAQRTQTLTHTLSVSNKNKETPGEPVVRMSKEQREELKQLQAQQKLNQKLFKTANKSKREKAELINEMTLNLSPELMKIFKTIDDHQEILKDLEINVKPQLNENLVTFSRKATSVYDFSVDLFCPSEPFVIHEKQAVLIYTAERFIAMVEEHKALSTFQNFQKDNDLKFNNLIVVIMGYDSLISKIRAQHRRKHAALVRQQLQPTSEPTTTTNGRKKSKPVNEIALTVDEIDETISLLEVNSIKTFTTKNIYDTLTRLRSFAYTISSSRYDKNERNPDFATIGALKSGKDLDQSYLFMLQTLPMMTEPRAKRVMEKIPTFRRLYETVAGGRSLLGNDGKNLFPGSIETMVRRLFSSEDEELLLRNQI